MDYVTVQKASNEQKGKLILGLGQTGLSSVRYFLKQGHEVFVYDTRANPPGKNELKKKYPQVKTYIGLIDENVLDNVSELILSPGLSVNTPIVQAAIQRGIPVVGDVEIFLQVAKAPVIAVTGSNGKSTTVSMIASILEQAHQIVKLGGNIGVPVLDLLDGKEPDFYILELSSFQLETTQSLAAKVAVILNVSEDHMDRYASFNDYAQTKRKILENAENCIINADDDWLVANVTGSMSCDSFTLSKPEPGQYGMCEKNGKLSLCHGEAVLMPANNLKIKGKHQMANALVAFAVADLCGVSRKAIAQSLKNFEGLPHRTQYVAEKAGVVYINDSKGTNVGATVAALEGFDQPIVLIAGGSGKGADFSELRYAIKHKVKHLVLIGVDAKEIASIANGLVPIEFADDMLDAVKKASAAAQTGDIVLLSPACASFDMFENYEHRGNVFVETVNRLVMHEC